MREELSRSLEVGGLKVADAIERVEQELAGWRCPTYSHITRAVSAQEDRFLCLETIFSKPAQDRPVPVAVVRVHFELDAVSGRLVFRFERESVEHEAGGKGLAPGMFEHWLDRIIDDKLQVRQLHDLATAFEETRLAPPPMFSVTSAEAEEATTGEEEATEEASLLQPTQSQSVQAQSTDDLLQDRLPLSVLLANIFDAADEEDEFELTHKEVADLLYATPLGLADWDIKLLLTSASEGETGKIEYKPFVQAAPEIIEALLKRRAAFEQRRKPGSEVSMESIELCYGEEIEEVSRAAREAFAAVDSVGKGTLSRHEFRSCLLSRVERFSMQEVQMLMQMCKEDDFGQVPYDDFGVLLHQLRIDALHNALVESDVGMLRTHLILLARRVGLQQDNIMTIWDLRSVLLSADQLCLSRVQIHALLSIVHPDEQGEVDMEYFLRVACTVIPQMFDTVAFEEKAAMIAKEKADAQAKQELEELQGITGGLAAKRRTDDEDLEDAQANAPDRDAVEKALLHICNQADEKHRQQPTLEVRRFLEAMGHESVQQCQLSEAELRGFIAEAELDERGEVAYVEHIKTWVPILFELRKSRIYDSILTKDWGYDAPQLVDLSEYEAQFPLQLVDEDSSANSRPSSANSARFRSGLGAGPNGKMLSSQLSGHEDDRKRRNSHRGGQAGNRRRPSSRSGRPGSARRALSRSGSARSLGRSQSNSSVDSASSIRSSRLGSRAPSRAG